MTKTRSSPIRYTEATYEALSRIVSAPRTTAASTATPTSPTLCQHQNLRAERSHTEKLVAYEYLKGLSQFSNATDR